MMGVFSLLAEKSSFPGPGESDILDDEGMKGCLPVVAAAVKELFELVITRHDGGVARRGPPFWRTAYYLDRAEFVMEQVKHAWSMEWSSTNPEGCFSSSPESE